MKSSSYLLNNARAPPAPRLNEVLRIIARAGGFLARKSDGEPGAKTIWEGLCHIRASAQTLKTLRENGLVVELFVTRGFEGICHDTIVQLVTGQL